MEGVLKQSEEIKNKTYDNIRRMYEEYQPMRNEAQRLMALNLPRNVPLPSVASEDDPIPPKWVIN